MQQLSAFGLIALIVLGTGWPALAQVEACKGTDPDAAIPACTKVLQKAQTARDRSLAYGYRGMAYAKKGLTDEALADGVRAIDADPKSSSGYVMRAYIYLRKPDNDRALADAERALKIDSNSAQAHHIRGIVLNRRGDITAALSAYDRALKIAPKSTFILADRGVALFASAEFDRAVADFTAAIATNPSLGGPYSYRGMAYAIMGEHDLALTDLGRALALEPKDARAYTFRARTYLDRGETVRALSDIERALELNPNSAEVFTVRGLAFLEDGVLEKALREFTRAIEIDPRQAQAYSSRCTVYVLRDEPDRGLADCSRAIELNPKLAAAYVGRGLFHASRHEHVQAIADYSKAVELVPKHFRALSQRARVYFDDGQYGKARADIERALQIHPKDARALLHRAMISAKGGQLDQALDDLAKAIARSPKLAEAYAVRGALLASKGATDAAVQDLRRVLALPSRNLYEKEAQVRAAELLTTLTRSGSTSTAVSPAGPQITPKAAPMATAAAATNERRVALVIGNSAYAHAGALRNPANDAKLVAAALKKVGFAEVIEHFDLGLQPMMRVLRDFGDVATNADWAIIYFAGHGLEMGGVPYMIPVDAKLERDAHVPDEAIPLDRLLQKAEAAKKLRLVILDACRNNPFATRMTRSGSSTRSIGRGLPALEPEGDVLVAYATKHGTTAMDGDGENSPYALALIEQMPRPDVDIRVMFGRVRDSVRKLTNNQQEPYTYGSVGGDLLFLVASAR